MGVGGGHSSPTQRRQQQKGGLVAERFPGSRAWTALVTIPYLPPQDK